MMIAANDKNKKQNNSSSNATDINGIPTNIANLINSDQSAAYDPSKFTDNTDPNSALPATPPAVSETNSNTINDTNPDIDLTMPDEHNGVSPDGAVASGAAISPVTKPASKLQKGLGTIAALAAGIGVAGRNKTGMEALQHSNEFSQEVAKNKAAIAQTQATTQGTQAQTAEQQQETARKGGIYAAQPPQTYEQQIGLQRKATPITEEQDVSGKKYTTVTNADGSKTAIPVQVQGAIGANSTLQGDPSKIDPFTTAYNAYVAKNGKPPMGDDLSQLVKDTSPRYITGVDQNASKERIATQNNATKLSLGQEATRRALGAAQIHWNAAQQMYASGQYSKYDLENTKGDIALMKQITANVGKDYATNPKMRALGIVDDATAEQAVNELQQRLDTREQLGKQRIAQNSGQYKQTAIGNGSNGFKKNTRYGSNDGGKTWVEIKSK